MPSSGMVQPNEDLYGGGSGKVIPEHLKHASEDRVASYASLRTFLNVYHPLFHACTMRQFFRALQYGLRADGQYAELEGQPGIPFTESLELLMGNPYGRPFVLVYDQRELEARYTLVDSGVPDYAGSTLFVLPTGIIPTRHLRGFVLGNRMYASPSRRVHVPTNTPQVPNRPPKHRGQGL